jgi:hypothetical protein
LRKLLLIASLTAADQLIKLSVSFIMGDETALALPFGVMIAESLLDFNRRAAVRDITGMLTVMLLMVLFYRYLCYFSGKWKKLSAAFLCFMTAGFLCYCLDLIIWKGSMAHVFYICSSASRECENCGMFRLISDHKYIYFDSAAVIMAVGYILFAVRFVMFAYTLLRRHLTVSGDLKKELDAEFKKEFAEWVRKGLPAKREPKVKNPLQ